MHQIRIGLMTVTIMHTMGGAGKKLIAWGVIRPTGGSNFYDISFKYFDILMH